MANGEKSLQNDENKAVTSKHNVKDERSDKRNIPGGYGARRLRGGDHQSILLFINIYLK
jgi:hypothetical protein